MAAEESGAPRSSGGNEPVIPPNEGARGREALPPAGLCAFCRHRRIVTSGKGAHFFLCLRSREVPHLPKYPALPVLACPEFSELAGDDSARG